MVTQFLLEVVFALIRGLISLGPRYTPPIEDVSAQAATLGGQAAALNGYVPVVQLGVVLTVLVVAKLALLAWQAVAFAYHQFWGSS
jgi:hypothetical protein